MRSQVRTDTRLYRETCLVYLFRSLISWGIYYVLFWKISSRLRHLSCEVNLIHTILPHPMFTSQSKISSTWPWVTGSNTAERHPTPQHNLTDVSNEFEGKQWVYFEHASEQNHLWQPHLKKINKTRLADRQNESHHVLDAQPRAGTGTAWFQPALASVLCSTQAYGDSSR